MEIVGHSAIEMTTNVYGHVNLDVQHSALDNSTRNAPDDDAVAVIESCQRGRHDH